MQGAGCRVQGAGGTSKRVAGPTSPTPLAGFWMIATWSVECAVQEGVCVCVGVGVWVGVGVGVCMCVCVCVCTPTPLAGFWMTLAGSWGVGCSEALGQLGQDEPASGMALEPMATLPARVWRLGRTVRS